MANDDPAPVAPGDPAPAAQEPVSLSQALLAPLDAIFKAQLHGARSFLNMLLQLGYPDEKAAAAAQSGGGGHEPSAEVAKDGKPFMLRFQHEITNEGRTVRQEIAIPALALVPVAPLAVQSAEFGLTFRVTDIGEHRQFQAVRAKARAKAEGKEAAEQPPWYLVRSPISMRGHLGTTSGKEGPRAQEDAESQITIQVKVGTVPMPAALDRLLTSLNQVSEISSLPSSTR